jgi:hypothetical protein
MICEKYEDHPAAGPSGFESYIDLTPFMKDEPSKPLFYLLFLCLLFCF